MTDALDRLKKRNRPKVAPRDASLTSGLQDIQTSRHTESETSSDEAVPTTTPEQTTAPASPDILESRHTDIETPKSPDDELQTKRSTFRMETNLIDRLHAFCRRQGLSREVLIEAMFEYMEAHPEAMGQVVADAGVKHDHRQQLANRKRAEAMMQKFGG